MSDWRPHRDPTEIGDFEVQYMTSSTHSHEGAHSVRIGEVSVLVAPDGRTTARQRSAALREALEIVSKQRLGDGYLALAVVVGSLVTAGITNIEVDGSALIPDDGDRIASIRLDVVQTDAGIEVELTDLGGTGGTR